MGRHIAERASLAGAKVIVSGRTAPNSKYGIDFFPCDVTSETQVETLISYILDKYGNLDMALNNAGITTPHDKLADSSSAQWTEALNVNLTGTYFCLKHEIKAMKTGNGGSIVNMSSAAGVLPIGSQAAYVTTKSAIIALTKSAAIDYATDSQQDKLVRINAVAPGPIVGGMNSNENLEANPIHTARKLGVTAMKRFGSADEVANAVIWLLSSDSSYITGSVISIDGGYSSGKF